MLKDALHSSGKNDMEKIEPANNPDPSDRATAESELNFTLRMRERNNGLVRKIEQALKRIDEGTFGICEECGEDISEGRLKARPITTFCIDCKRKQELNEAVMGI